MLVIPLAALTLALAGTPPKPVPLAAPPKSYVFHVATIDGGGLKLIGGKGTWWTSLMFPGGRTTAVTVSFDGARVGVDPVDLLATKPGGGDERKDLVLFLGSEGIEKVACHVDECGLTLTHRDGKTESITLKRAESRDVSAVRDVDVTVQR